jgi:hypothetical protein
MADYESRRRRHASYAMAQLDEHVARLEWPRERIAAERDLRLRQLIGIARNRCPWHHERLADTDEETFAASQLGGLAPMTKDDLLGHFDDIVTDQRLSLGLVEAHLERLTSDAYLLNEYHAIASGGSSGRRGVYVYDWAGWATYYLSAARHITSDRLRDPVLAAAPRVEAVIAADKPAHGSSALYHTFSKPAITSVRIPISLPMSEIVARLNDLRPTALRGYPSARPARVRGAGRSPEDRTAAAALCRRGDPARGARPAQADLAGTGPQPVGRLGDRHAGLLLSSRAGLAPQRRPRHRRTRGPRRPARPAGSGVRQGLRDQPVQHPAAVDPVRGHRRGHGP